MKLVNYDILKVGKPYLVYYGGITKKVVIGRFLGPSKSSYGRDKKLCLDFATLQTYRSWSYDRPEGIKVWCAYADKTIQASATGEFFELTEKEFMLQCALQI